MTTMIPLPDDQLISRDSADIPKPTLLIAPDGYLSIGNARTAGREVMT